MEVDRIFTPDFSEDGCRRREREELVIMHWRDYLQECEANCFANVSEPLVSLPMIMIFATGLEEEPPLGFHDKPTICIWEDVRPKSNTCAHILYLPLHNDKDDLSYEEFQEMMNDEILNSPTFGGP
ncbi:G2/M phase-specific E3 ubiquitin-protein ligase-like [Xenia sp. Carnegie-2017]|uniref:G2/M phase-specific E3 ubiquitin-protein ligase-like n=1 Tax=Xenia sp. Carnegie-2017 TaxID=2897299 RepID=UPI001F03EA99|nr:G2/M phase-specific E3 ubiquitin-protein ligase-like [Xenia sp. Carnegie-2017]XP_046855568.1 G2/M phase-specific E3 ubiquitin-protein ligase-like [Xenia sp. Carnegie-2017]